MDDNKLIQLIFNQRPVPDQAFDTRIDSRARQLVREEQVMKKKISVLTISVALLLSLALFGAVAELLGLNLFEWFGKDNQRLKELAPKAALQEVSPVSTTEQKLGTATAAITSAYYDGQSLILGYAVENGNALETFDPTPEQLAQMEKDTNPLVMVISNPETEGLIKQWNDAVQAGQPFGFVQHSISVSDHTVNHEGHDLPASSETRQPEGTALYTIREYHSPLPKELQDKDMLQLEISLAKLTVYRYFDGKEAHVMSQFQELAPMKATIWRSDAKIQQYAGEGSYLGHPVKVSVTASAAYAQATLHLEDGVFPALPEHAWYQISLLDENQQELRPQSERGQNTAAMSILFDGTGNLPQRLTLRLQVATGKGIELEDELKEEMTIRLELTQ